MTFAPGQAVVYRKLTSSTPRRATVVRREERQGFVRYVIDLDGIERAVYEEQLAPFERHRPIDPAPEPSAPVTEMTDQGEQIVIPGAERSAVQAAATRPERIRPKRSQAAPGGMFAFEPPQPTLF